MRNKPTLSLAEYTIITACLAPFYIPIYIL